MDANGVMSLVYDPELRALRVDGDATGGGSITSVNGQTGDVVLTASDVGADPAGSAATVDSALDDHLADPSDAHDASAISVDPTGFANSSSTDAQAVLADLDAAIGGAGITALTGDVTASGSGSVAATITNNAVTNAKSAQMAAHTYKGNNTGSSADPIDVTLAQLKTELNLSGSNTGDQTITLTGDVTGSGTGSFVATIPNDTVTYAKIQNVSATDKLLGRATAGAGDIEEITLTAAGRALIDDADAAAQRTTLGLGTLATQSGTFSGTSSGTNTGDQTITLTGDVTGSGTGSFAATIGNNKVTYAQMQDISATSRFLGRKTAGAGDPEELTAADAKTILAIAESDVANLTTDLAAKQPLDATLTALAGANWAANALPIGSGADTLSQISFAANTFPARSSSGNLVAKTITDFGLSLVDDADAAAGRTTLGVVIGTNVQAWDADLDTWATKTAPSGTPVGTTDTQTLTNKRVTPRVTATSGPGATPTINTDNCDFVDLTAIATAITSMTTNLSGTPTNGQKLMIRFKDDGTARAITWGSSFEALGQALPTTTVISKRLTVGFVYDTGTSKWGCVAAAQEA